MTVFITVRFCAVVKLIQKQERRWWQGKDWVVGPVLFVVGTALSAFLGVKKEWDLGIWIGAMGLVVSIAGFSTALLEIRKTQHAADATQQAVNRTLKGVAASRLGIDIVRMRRLADEFETAARVVPLGDEQVETVRRTLTEWRHLANEAKALASRRFGDEHVSIGTLNTSIEGARAAKEKIFDKGMSREDVRDALASMEKTLDALAPLLEQLYPNTEDPHMRLNEEQAYG